MKLNITNIKGIERQIPFPVQVAAFTRDIAFTFHDQARISSAIPQQNINQMTSAGQFALKLM